MSPEWFCVRTSVGRVFTFDVEICSAGTTKKVRGGGCRACTHVALALSIPAVLVYVASERLQVVILALMMLVACVAAIATRCGERRAASITVLEILSRQVKTPLRG